MSKGLYRKATKGFVRPRPLRCHCLTINYRELPMEGYLLVATGHNKYYEMAVTAAASLKMKDPKRPVALVYDGGIEIAPDAGAFFDYLVNMPTDDRYIGCMNKLRIYKFTPFDKTMFVDADCIMMQPGVDEYWNKHREKSFSVFGDVQKSGKVVGRDVERMLAVVGASFTVEFRIPNYLFTHDSICEGVFEKANALFLECPDIVSSLHKGVPGQYADEPFIGLTLGTYGIGPDEISYSKPLVITTWRARNFEFDFEKVTFDSRRDQNS